MPRCKYEKEDGTRCRAPESLVGDDGYCPSHRPDPEARERLRKAARKGGKARSRKLAREGLEEADLPPLESPQDASKWLEVVARGVALGKLGHHEGKAVARLVREWLRANEAGAVQERIDALEERLEAAKRGGLEVLS